jgi:hypothetical protein
VAVFRPSYFVLLNVLEEAELSGSVGAIVQVRPQVTAVLTYPYEEFNDCGSSRFLVN